MEKEDKDLFKDPNEAFAIRSPLSRHRRTISHDYGKRGKVVSNLNLINNNDITTPPTASKNNNVSRLPTIEDNLPFESPPGSDSSSMSGYGSTITPGSGHKEGLTVFVPIPHKDGDTYSKSNKRPVPDPRAFPNSPPSLLASEMEIRPSSPATPPNRRRRITDSDENPLLPLPQSSLMQKDYETPKSTFTLPPSPTPDKRRRGASFTQVVRYKPNINIFTPEGRLLKDNVKESNFEYDLVSPYKEFPNSSFSQQFEQLILLGKGSYGEVYKCRHRVDGCLYAIKRTIRKSRGARDRQNILREVYGLAVITNHSHIVRYYGAWEEDERLYIQTEYCAGGSLKLASSPRIFTEKELLNILCQVTEGLHHIHALNLVHLDIKPENIYLKFPEGEGPCIYKIGDLGLMNEANDNKIFMDGDCRYLSRELLEDNMTSLRKSDVFSLGATLYELARAKPLPQGGDEWREIRDGIIQCTPQYSDEFWALIKSLLLPDPTVRPSTEEILQHPLLVDKNNPFNHTVDCCPLKSALETSQQEVLQLRQQIKTLEEQLVVAKRSCLSPNVGATPPPPDFPSITNDLLNKMQL